MGLYILYATSDDVNGCFQCKDENDSSTFPIVKVLSKAFEGESQANISVMGCQNWKTS